MGGGRQKDSNRGRRSEARRAMGSYLAAAGVGWGRQQHEASQAGERAMGRGCGCGCEEWLTTLDDSVLFLSDGAWAWGLHFGMESGIKPLPTHYGVLPSIRPSNPLPGLEHEPEPGTTWDRMQ
ncbi:hypothetical protein AA0113_g11079 [Alternaria arborescens]|uniref:Uncharacterized protein n=1 Tax=Alternaria arborescens TaxID=156630 RepID=A0A4Q4QGE9_9PLEO|nr:hypothetical protein AA0113_g11079 [Alternaria arborescens]